MKTQNRALTYDEMLLKDPEDLRVIRFIKRIKQKELAAYLECTYNLISMWENGKSGMSLEKIEKYRYFISNYNVSKIIK
jgi:transcriptional regulator with XRE-family HTH domain